MREHIEAPTVFGGLGFGLLVGGVGLLSVPLALIVAGALLLGLAVAAAVRG